MRTASTQRSSKEFEELAPYLKAFQEIDADIYVMVDGDDTYDAPSVHRLIAPLASVLSYRSELQDELLDVRRMFEPAVARAAATRVTDEDLADLQRILDAQRKKLESGRSVVVSVMATLNDLLVESRKLTLKQKGRPGRSIQGHEAVVAALRQRDGGAAAEAMREHIHQIADLLQQSSTRVR